ncbi:hypothetical protein M9H77_08730 [Catharanthus roseus]|uniref:Uncharacterized protein n=1 Tax=Catharanthus roseus TaxID=4058 RepID=A0ACC0BYN7_CATRO|nr:hypothetical protein M9H77_08730 [Catharanthus roseus]
MCLDSLRLPSCARKPHDMCGCIMQLLFLVGISFKYLAYLGTSKTLLNSPLPVEDDSIEPLYKDKQETVKLLQGSVTRVMARRIEEDGEIQRSKLGSLEASKSKKEEHGDHFTFISSFGEYLERRYFIEFNFIFCAIPIVDDYDFNIANCASCVLGVEDRGSMEKELGPILEHSSISLSLNPASLSYEVSLEELKYLLDSYTFK